MYKSLLSFHAESIVDRTPRSRALSFKHWAWERSSAGECEKSRVTETVKHVSVGSQGIPLGHPTLLSWGDTPVITDDLGLSSFATKEDRTKGFDDQCAPLRSATALGEPSPGSATRPHAYNRATNDRSN